MKDIFKIINGFVAEDKQEELKTTLLEATNENTTEKKDEVKIGFLNTGDFIPVSKLNEKTEEIKKLNEQGTKYSTQIDELKNSKNVSEEAKKEIASLQATNDKAMKNFEVEKTNLTKKYELQSALKTMKVKGAGLLVSQVIGDEKLNNLISVKDGKVSGIDNVITNLKENDEYKDLFSEIVETKIIGNDPVKLQNGDDNLKGSTVDTLERELKQFKDDKNVKKVIEIRNQIDRIKQEQTPE